MLKKILPFVVIILFSVLLIIGYLFKGSINNQLSDMMKAQASPEINATGLALVDSLYNYSKNGLPYEITFLEFGSTGCSACKRMEKVMEEIKQKYPDKINVVFYNVTLHENHDLMKYYGIAAIPTQVLLNKTGKEYYRHTGFLSSDGLVKKFFF